MSCRGYLVLPDSVNIERDASGKGTGVATVSFASGLEAKRAIKERNRTYIKDRYIDVSRF